MNEFFTSPITMFITLAVLAFGCYSDAKSSKDFIYYGMDEQNLARDKDKNFSPIKYVLAFGAIATMLTLANLFVDNYVAKGFSVLAAAVIGIIAYVFSMLNNQKKKKMRELQIRTLENRDWGSNYIQRNGKTFYGLFRWLDSTNPYLPAAIEEVNAKLNAFAADPKFPA